VSALQAPQIDYAGLSPLLALSGGACLTLLLGLVRGPALRALVVTSTLATLALATGLAIWQLGENKSIVEGALRVDDLALTLDFVFFVAAAAVVLLSFQSPPAIRGREGDFYTLLHSSVTGMAVLASALNLIPLFLGIEVLSIPLYLMCAGRADSREQLESGLM
jgi:NADH-quinone oxidoreductase subunit N